VGVVVPNRPVAGGGSDAAAAGHWDWNFLLKAVKAAHKPPSVYGVALPLGRNESSAWQFGSHILNNGGHFVSQDLKDVIFDSPEVREAVDLMRELSQYTPPGATSWANPELVDAIVKSTCAMGMYSGRVFVNLVNQNPSLISKMSNTFIPYNKEVRSWGGIGAHGLFKGAKNPVGAKELLKFSMRKEQCIALMLTRPGTYAVSIPAYGSDPSYTNDPVLKAFDPTMLANVNDTVKGFGDFLKEGPGWKSNPKAGVLSGSLVLADIIQKVAVGKESTQSAVTFGAQQIRDIMKG